MTPLTAATLHGVWGSVLLPIDPGDGIDWVRLAAELDVLAASNLDGTYAHGTAGEFHTLSEDEFDRVSGMLAAACSHTGKPFQIGASHPVPQISIERIARTRDLGPGAFQVVLPDWLAPSDDECITFVRRIAQVADPVPLVLYSPPHAKKPAHPDLLVRLLDEVPELIGLKVVDGDDAWYASMQEVLARCAVFVPGHRLAGGICRGAPGSYSNVAALSPEGAARWYSTARSDLAAAADVEQRIAALFARHVEPLKHAGFPSPALDKFLAAVGDWADIGLRVRWPYARAPDDAVAAARRDAHVLVPELFVE